MRNLARLACAVVALLVPSCGGGSHSRAYEETPLGVRFSMNPDVTEAEAWMVSNWIDKRVREWIWRKVEWGCDGYTDAELLAFAKSVPVIIFKGYTLPNKPISTVGWNYYGDRIEIPVDYPCGGITIQWDPRYKHLMSVEDTEVGLRHLPHEFTHTVRGDWHPEP